VHLSLSGVAIPEPGDMVEITVEADDSVATVRARLVRIGPDGLEFKSTTDWRCVGTNASHRRRLQGGYCYWVDRGEDLCIEMTDLSKGGFGFLSPYELPRDETLAFSFVGRQGEIRVHGRVAHMVQLQDDLYRGGVQIEPQGRLEVATWQRLVREAA
jgi:hypothetical protein